jgi:hypothetical protein
MGWDGMGWDGMGWDGMGWDGMGWDGMGWDGMGWDGMGTFVHLYQVLSFFYSNNPVGHYADADKSYIKMVHKTNRMSYI